MTGTDDAVETLLAVPDCERVLLRNVHLKRDIISLYGCCHARVDYSVTSTQPQLQKGGVTNATATLAAVTTVPDHERDLIRNIHLKRGMSYVHFACHGIQDVHEPLTSGFQLHDGKLTLLDILGQKIQSVDYAFLSA